MGTFYQMSRQDVIQCQSGEGIRSRSVNAVRTVHDAQVKLSNQLYMHRNMNTTDNLVHVSALLVCHHHQGVQILMCASECVSEWLPHITDQFEGHNFNRYKDSLMMALKKDRNMRRIVCLLYSHFSARTVSLLNWIVPICFTVILTPAWMDYEKL